MNGLLRALVPILLVVSVVCPPANAEMTSPWVDGYNSKVRLVAGQAITSLGNERVVAGVEIVLADGWKTYWRSPGDSGGVPPHFDWGASANVMSAQVLYPAPVRLKDAAGEAVGYKASVTFPVAIVPEDPAKPMELRLQLEFGICREICVPAEAKLELLIPPGPVASAPPSLQAALRRVPLRALSQGREDAPRLADVRAAMVGTSPRLEIAAVFPGGSAGSDIFVEAPEGIYLPVPRRVGKDDGSAKATFEVDLSSGVDLEDLKGKMLTITLVGSKMAVERTWEVPQ